MTGLVELEAEGTRPGVLGAALAVLEHHFPEARISGYAYGRLLIALGSEVRADRCWHPPATSTAPASPRPPVAAVLKTSEKAPAALAAVSAKPCRPSYTADDKSAAVALVAELGLAAASARLDIAHSVLRRWVTSERGADDGDRGDDTGVGHTEGGTEAGLDPIGRLALDDAAAVPSSPTDLASRIRRNTAAINARTQAPPRSALVPSGLRYPIDHEEARRRAYPTDGE